MGKNEIDFTNLHQYLNAFSASIREAGDKTSNSLLEVKSEIASLNSNLNTTNYLLIGLLILNTALLIFTLYKNKKR
ncbi:MULTISPECIES: hypothetical protein [Brevibacillus]|uniref:hypothetical protein n=1 Tax=Brevibacillus TaxID=55080 RepID=UPI000469885D|nr:hypothetical protein [Brevibacillus borstelensis]MBE5396341.1 hypothetical protein [Brevibacillus borstelensis]MCC0567117.1 hypothetical protein [Brevibacillus borstelensis]MCM3625687.1 hypothetical protein [Brevibacillus borstelensis]MED1876904.1 hypothetical protein [Brevibacillus borstelensis]NOU56337.1 hypothetical protein [Brevibacillus borstelensis]